jgi:hypothetical protein
MSISRGGIVRAIPYSLKNVSSEEVFLTRTGKKKRKEKRRKREARQKKRWKLEHP